MAKTDILYKLQQQLRGTRLFEQEMEVVYFMVELRKFMDHNDVGRTDEHTIIRFYCDWLVHTDKNQHLADLKEILDRLYASCKERIEQSSLNPHQRIYVADNFLYLEDLRNTLFTFFREYDLDTFMLTDETCWQSFVKQMLLVLQDQPIRNYEERNSRGTDKVIKDSNIKEIRILQTDDRGAHIKVAFYEPILDNEGHPKYEVELSSGHPI